MKRGTRRIITCTALVIFMMTSLLSGCGKSTETGTEQNETAPGADMTASDNASDEATVAPEAQEKPADSDAQATEAPAADLNETIEYTYQNHPITMVNGDTTMIMSNYYTAELDKSDSARYPKLQEALNAYAKSDEERARSFLADNENEVLVNIANGMSLSYENDVTFEPRRSDGRVLSFISCDYLYLAGAHGYASFKGYNFDPSTGEEILFKDVIKNTDDLPLAIYKELIRQNDDLFGYFEDCPGDKENLIEGMPERFEDNAKGIAWAIDYDGVWFCFEDYAMGSYAAGARYVKVPFADYPDIFVNGWDSYADADKMPESGTGAKELKEAETDVTVSSGEYVDEEDDYMPRRVDVENPGWSAWTADGIDTAAGEPGFRFDEISENTSEWLDTDKWAADKGISLPGFANAPYYSAGGYSFSVTDDAENGTLDLVVMTDEDNPTVIGDFYFTEFLNSPDKGTGMFAQFTTPGIFYAQMQDGILYVALGHRTYAAADPHKAYIIAIDTVTGKTLWKSNDQVSGANNFVIRGDSLICGYGFTDEPDYIYILNRANGKVQKKIKVRSAPDYFIPEGDDKLYVLTYNTEYLYSY